MLDFIANNMAKALPMSLIFLLGTYLIQSGLKRLQSGINIHPIILFVCYWLVLSTGIFKYNGPTPDIGWIVLIGFITPVIGLLFYAVSFVISKIRKQDKEVSEDECL